MVCAPLNERNYPTASFGPPWLGARSFVLFLALSIVSLTDATGSERGSGDTLRLLYWQAPTIVNPHL